MMGDWIVYIVVWDETIEELDSNPSGGGERGIFEDLNGKIGIPLVFLILVTVLSYDHIRPLDFIMNALPLPAQMGLLGEQNRPE